jgi:hypothetical protein
MTNPVSNWDYIEPHDNEFVMNLVDANERMGEAQVKIATAAGVPAPYGVDQIVEKVTRMRVENERLHVTLQEFVIYLRSVCQAVDDLLAVDRKISITVTKEETPHG